MLIAHASIPSDNPEQTAQVLAEIMSGEATPFPPGGPDSFMAWSGDGAFFIEVIKRGTALLRGPEEAEYRVNEGAERRLTETHLAITVERPAAEIVEIAKGAGWPARAADRGNGYFHLVEVWIDSAFLIEFLDPAQTATYAANVTLAKWKSAMASGAVS